MARKIGFRARLRYWFDNTMSRGIVSLIGWLAAISVALIVVTAIALRFTDPNASSQRGHGIFTELWDTFVTTFALAVPTDTTLAPIVIALWFVLAVGGIFIVSALVGLLTNAFQQKVEQLRKGRSPIVESDHTVILGWSDQIYTVVSELVEANESRRRATVAILAEQDKVDMDEWLRHRLGKTGRTQVITRNGSPLDLSDLELMNLNQARSIIVLAPTGASV